MNNQISKGYLFFAFSSFGPSLIMYLCVALIWLDDNFLHMLANKSINNISTLVYPLAAFVFVTNGIIGSLIAFVSKKLSLIVLSFLFYFVTLAYFLFYQSLINYDPTQYHKFYIFLVGVFIVWEYLKTKEYF